MNLSSRIERLKGPILIIGASGFVGVNLLRACTKVRKDVVGTFFSGDSWRLRDIPTSNTLFLNLQDLTNVRSVFARVRPRTIFDCSSFGAYSFEQDFERIHSTNYLSFIRLMEEMLVLDIDSYIHAGSSSEYGLNASEPDENSLLIPNSHYAVSKAACSQAIMFYGKIKKLPIINLRLYSVYGAYEDSSRLIPVLCQKLLQKKLPTFAAEDVSRDFIYIDDVVNAFICAAISMSPEIAGESFNIGTGVPSSLKSLAKISCEIFDLTVEPEFNNNVGRAWDVNNWFANPTKAQALLNWQSEISLKDGLMLTQLWWKEYLEKESFETLTKKEQVHKNKNSISAIIACYKDNHAIPIMYERLKSVFNGLNIDYEIIFINDNSPDDSAEVIRKISACDPRVLGVTHARNFGSQAAFRSGMELATKEACVLLDGDLQDPPELIEEFIKKWREGADVVYGHRIKREMPIWLETCYKGFYRIFSIMSEIPIPKDAGDFSLIDHSVVYWILQCKERDSFLRGLRAYVGFNQVGVDYKRPERMFGVSTNNLLKNIGWAKKGIFSFSRMPLHMLTAFGGVACVGTFFLAMYAIFMRIVFPELVPQGATFISLLIMFFGSATIFSLGILGEYIGKILEETKARPSFIRKNIIIRGEIKPSQCSKGY